MTQSNSSKIFAFWSLFKKNFTYGPLEETIVEMDPKLGTIALGTVVR
jgi:hypothetical protein